MFGILIAMHMFGGFPMNSILIADDDKYFRDRINEFLVNRGYNVTAVANSGDAVKEIAQNKYDVVILDVYMEGIGIEQTLLLIKNIRPECMIIVITGDSSINLERTIRTYGVYYYLLKPFDMIELHETIESAIKHKHS